MVLTGTFDDGTTGSWAIKTCGGVTNAFLSLKIAAQAKKIEFECESTNFPARRQRHGRIQQLAPFWGLNTAGPQRLTRLVTGFFLYLSGMAAMPRERRGVVHFDVHFQARGLRLIKDLEHAINGQLLDVIR